MSEIEDGMGFSGLAPSKQEKYITELERKLKIASEVISFGLDNIDEIEGLTQGCEDYKRDIRKTLEYGASEIKGSEK